MSAGPYSGTPYTVVTVLEGDDMETAVDHVWASDAREAVMAARRDGHTVAVFTGHHEDETPFGERA